MNLFKLSLFLLLFLHMPLHAKNESLEKVTLQLQWKHQFEFAGFYAAKEKGFYRDNGLDVSFLEYNSKINIVDTVLSDKAQYGLSYSSIIADYLNGKPIVMLENFFKQSPLILVAQEEIRTPADLKGKKVMGVSSSIDDITLLTMLEKFNISLSDTQTVPANFSIDDFVNRKVDAMSAFTTNELYELNKRGIRYTVLDPTVYGTKYYDVNLFTTTKEVQENPSRVQKFREASIKGWEYALSHQDEIIQLILEKYNTQNKTKEALAFEAKQIEQIMLPKIYPIGSIDTYRIKMIAESFRQAGFIKAEKQRSLADFIYKKNPDKLILTAAEHTFIKNHPSIVLGTEKAWKPYIIVKKDGTISGYDADVLKLINQVSGSNFVLEAGDWAKMQTKAKAKEIDGLSTGGIHDERKTYLNFSDIYISMRKMLITSKDNPKNIQTLHDLNGKTIAIHKSNLVDEKMAQKFPKSKIIKLDTIEEVIVYVATGKADAMFGNGATFYLANELGLPYLKRVARLDDTLELAFGVRKDWPEAISIINKSLVYIGEHKLLELKNKWFWQDKATVLDKNYQKLKLAEDEKQYLKKKKEIKMCIDPNWMPFEKIDKGKHIGMSADYINIISSRINTPITMVPTKTWMESIEFGKARKCDIFSLMMETPLRKKYLNFTAPYLSIPLVIATRNDKFFITNIDELKDKKIGIVKGYAFVELFKLKYPDIKFIEVATIADGLKDVNRGKTFGFIDNLTTVVHQIQKNFSDSLKIAGRFDERWELGIGVRNDAPVLLGILNKAIASIDEKTKQQIINQWVSVKYEKGFDYKLFWKVLIPFLILGLLLLISQFTLKTYNKRLKKEIAYKIEELRHKDEILLKKHRMAEMGEMLSMIAHQWRQPLGAISSAVMGIEVKLASGKFDLSDKNDQKKFLAYLERKHQSINDYVQYLSETTDDFRNFFNPNKTKESVSLTAPIESALQILQKPMENNGIEIIKDFKARSNIELYQNEVTQVILNLLKNCEDNFLDKKIVDPKITIATYTRNNNTIITICDNGGGVSEDIIDKIFDPYFSTKDEKNGAGLGLYMSKKIIEDHNNGILDIKNTRDGVCFEVIF